MGDLYAEVVARWEPGAYGRLQQAALELFTEQGFESTTVAQIAERAGLTKRTFFHHFADKREVLFSGSEDAEEFIVAAIRAQPGPVDPLHAATAGIKTAADTIFEQQRDAAVKRGRLIAASPELQERDMVKRATLAETVAAALRDPRNLRSGRRRSRLVRRRGFLRRASARWSEAANRQPLAQLIDEILEEFLIAAAYPLPSSTKIAPVIRPSARSPKGPARH